MLSGRFSSARWSFGQQSCDLHQVVGEHGGCDPQLKALATFGETTLHATAAEQHRDAPLDAGAKALALPELPALLIGFALVSFDAARWWDADHLDAFLLARHHVLLAEEATIRSV